MMMIEHVRLCSTFHFDLPSFITADSSNQNYLVCFEFHQTQTQIFFFKNCLKKYPSYLLALFPKGKKVKVLLFA